MVRKKKERILISVFVASKINVKYSKLFFSLFFTAYFYYKIFYLRFSFTFILIAFFAVPTFSQIVVSGNVLDKSKRNYVENVRVFSTSGKIAITDSVGHYKITVNKTDSIYFVYETKPTQKFAVSIMPNPSQFDVSLHLNIKSRYSLLQEVVVTTRNYRQDSAENRSTYAEVFKHHNPRVETNFVTGGAAGFDANELFSLFRPKYNRRMQKLQQLMISNEEEQYVNYKFNKTFVKRITQIKGIALDTFMVWYRPSYNFITTVSELEFNQYILDASYQFRKLKPSYFLEADKPKK